MAPKKTKPANDSAPLSPLLNIAWQNIWGLADDTRAELHKQTKAVIALADGVLRGVTAYALNINDRSDRLAQEALFAADRSGRALAANAQTTGLKLISSYRASAAQIAASTRESARNVAERATATARVLVAPSKAA